MNAASAAVRFPPAAIPARAVTDRASRLPVRGPGNTAGPARAATPADLAATGLPPVTRILAVIARPGQEAADLGALLHAFRRAGTSLALLCLTRGEASPLNSTCERLEVIRPWELHVAASMLRVSSVMVADFPDTGLSRFPLAVLTERVERALCDRAPDLLLRPDPAGSPDDARAIQRAAVAAHASQSEQLPRLQRELDTLGRREQLRWLITPLSRGVIT